MFEDHIGEVINVPKVASQLGGRMTAVTSTFWPAFDPQECKNVEFTMSWTRSKVLELFD